MNNAQILIADDNVAMGEMFKVVLGDEGIGVDVVIDGESAIQQVQKKNYDVVFIDVIMPGLDGVETLEKIRQFNKNIKVVLMTGYTVQEKLERAKQFDVYDIIIKPIEINNILKIIDDIKKNNRKE